MSESHRATRHSFTEAARRAALAKRREMAARPRDIMAPEVFVVRLASASNMFTWELRRFGGVVLGRGEVSLPSVRQAYEAGLRALAASPPT